MKKLLAFGIVLLNLATILAFGDTPPRFAGPTPTYLDPVAEPCPFFKTTKLVDRDISFSSDHLQFIK